MDEERPVMIRMHLPKARRTIEIKKGRQKRKPRLLDAVEFADNALSNTKLQCFSIAAPYHSIAMKVPRLHESAGTS